MGKMEIEVIIRRARGVNFRHFSKIISWEEKDMAANVETMFSVREKPWHGLGTVVANALSSKEALIAAGLDWNVIQEPIYTDREESISGYRANIRVLTERCLEWFQIVTK